MLINNKKFDKQFELSRGIISDDSLKEHTYINNEKLEHNYFVINSMGQTS